MHNAGRSRRGRRRTGAWTATRTKYDYDDWGELALVKNNATPSIVYYELDEADAVGREREATLGNGLTETRVYDRANGYLATIQTGTSASVQDLSYAWDEVGNLIERYDDIPGKDEDFTYDALNRLETVDLNGSPFLTIEYDAIGNIEYKSDYGNYAYGVGSGGPHALTDVTDIFNREYVYNENGNMTEWEGDPITWYSFNKPKKIEYGSDYSELWYGADRQRIKQIAATGASSGTLHYVGSEFEVLIAGPLKAFLHHIFANGRAVARYTNYNFQAADLRYLHRDHLGSVVATTSDSGTVLSRYEFDVFGVRDQTSGSGLYTQKGFTGHEHLDAVDLVDMGGRVQDPFTGRFLSPDPFVQAPYYSQSLNRYSYVLNNPTSYLDPSGFQCMAGLYVHGGYVGSFSDGQDIAYNPSRFMSYSLQTCSPEPNLIPRDGIPSGSPQEETPDAQPPAPPLVNPGLQADPYRGSGWDLGLELARGAADSTVQIMVFAGAGMQLAMGNWYGASVFYGASDIEVFGPPQTNLGELGYDLGPIVPVTGIAGGVRASSMRALQRLAARDGVAVRNAHLAGKVHPKTGIPFDRSGFPDFSGVSQRTVSIQQTGNRAADALAANRAAGLQSTPRGYTWHHHQDGRTMQLVPTEIHRATGHTGGVALGGGGP